MTASLTALSLFTFLNSKSSDNSLMTITITMHRFKATKKAIKLNGNSWSANVSRTLKKMQALTSFERLI